jgi:hypothetical protein
MWNFFRLENEHLNNCGHFRAIKDIPLPFHIRVAGDSDEDEDEDEDENTEGMSVKDHGSDTEGDEQDGEQDGAGIGQPKPYHPVASSSRVSIQSGDASSQTGVVRRPVPPKRRQSGSSSFGPPFGLERSTTFVDDALEQAGFASDQFEQLASSALNKFYDRRDFESRIDGGEESYRRHKARNSKALSTPGIPLGTGLGIDSQGSGGAKVPTGVSSDATSTKTKPSLSNMLQSGIRVWRDDSDDEDDEDDDDSEDENQ